MRTLPHVILGCTTVWVGSKMLHRLPGVAAHKAPPQADAGAARDQAPSHVEIDYRLVAIGSMVPDLVDKTLRRFALKGELKRNDHLIGHTIALSLPGLFVAWRGLRGGDLRALGFAVSSLTHLAADPVARSPRTLFWPLLGLTFPDVAGFGRVPTAISQGVAAVAMLLVVGLLWRRGRLKEFLLTGRL